MSQIQFDTFTNAAGTGAPSATFGMIIGAQAAVASDANLTMVVGDKDVQVFNITATRNVTLPTTSVKAGRVIRLENRGAFDLVVKSSDGTTISAANAGSGSAGDPTIRVGWVVLVALQDTPTAPSHWRVSDVWEQGSDTGTVTTGLSGTPSVTSTWERHNKLVMAYLKSATGTGSSTDLVTSAFNPSRLRPTTQNARCPILTNNAGAINAAVGRVDTGGIFVASTNTGNYSGTCQIDTQYAWNIW